MNGTIDVKERLRNLGKLIGNTPLLEIDFLYKGQKRKIYAKSENMNMTGSIKDRMALHILEEAYDNGDIKPGDKIIEATSGNTGISFSAIGKALGHEVTILMPDWMSRERVDLIQSLGAHIIPITKEQGGFVGSVKKSEEMAEGRDDIFLPCQFSNDANAGAHESTTGPEIWSQLEFNSLKPEVFISGVGTGGTIMGVGRFLKKMDPTIKVHPLEPAESPTMSTGHKVGHHRIQGISDEFIPAIINFDELDEIVAVSDGDSILMAQQLSKKLGLAVGISSGANFIGALQKQDEMGGDVVAVTIFADDNKKYLSTDLLREELIKDDYVTPDVELLGFRVFKRVCKTCCEREKCDLYKKECCPHI